MPSWATGLALEEFESAPLQVQFCLPVAGSNAQTAPGVDTTSSCRPSARSTTIGVLHVALSCSEGKLQTSSPFDFRKATIELLSAAAVTITRSSVSTRLEAVPQLRSS